MAELMTFPSIDGLLAKPVEDIVREDVELFVAASQVLITEYWSRHEVPDGIYQRIAQGLNKIAAAGSEEFPGLIGELYLDVNLVTNHMKHTSGNGNGPHS